MDDGGKVDWGFSASRDVDLLKVSHSQTRGRG